MMDFVINGEELAALCGLPHIQQLTYLRGIRPYMDVKSGITGVKRRISYQSIAEQLYIEPHQGIKSQNFSRDQVRRAVSGLQRSGMIEIHSEGKQLILKCLLASRHFSVQNKATINPPQKADTNPRTETLLNTGVSEDVTLKTNIAEPQKAATPLKEDNYIYLIRQFEHFWRMYPEKKSRERAFETFRKINPDESLLRTMIQAIENQIKARTAREVHGEWVPPWKYPENWLAKKCWEDEVKIELKQEKRNEKCRPNTKAEPHDPFWNPDTEDTASTSEGKPEQNNVFNLQYYRQQ